MRRYFFLLLLVLALLSACAQQEASLVEVDTVPKEVNEAIDPEARLQVVNKSGEVYYIVFQSTEDVEVDLQMEDATALVKLDEVTTKSDERTLSIYSLTRGSDHDTIDIQVNGESMSYPMTIVD